MAEAIEAARPQNDRRGTPPARAANPIPTEQNGGAGEGRGRRRGGLLCARFASGDGGGQRGREGVGSGGSAAPAVSLGNRIDQPLPLGCS